MYSSLDYLVDIDCISLHIESDKQGEGILVHFVNAFCKCILQMDSFFFVFFYLILLNFAL